MRLLRLLDLVGRYLWGRDVFISYAHRDGRRYTLALAQALTKKGLACFVDQYVSKVDDQVPPDVLRALRRASMLVVVTTPHSTKSKAVLDEIRLFKETERPIHPINLHPDYISSEIAGLLPGLTPASDAPLALESGEVRPEVVTEIRDAATFRRQQARLTFAIAGATCLLAVLVVIGGYASVRVARVTVDLNQRQRLLAEATAALDLTRKGLGNSRLISSAQSEPDPLVRNRLYAQMDPTVEPSQNEWQAAITLAQERVPLQFDDTEDHTLREWTPGGEGFTTETNTYGYRWSWTGERLTGIRQPLSVFKKEIAASRTVPVLTIDYVADGLVRVLGQNDAILAEKKIGEHIYDHRIATRNPLAERGYAARGILEGEFKTGHALVAYRTANSSAPGLWSSQFGDIALKHNASVSLVKLHPFLNIAATECGESESGRTLQIWTFSAAGARLVHTVPLGANYRLSVPSFSPDGGYLLLSGKARGFLDLAELGNIQALDDLSASMRSLGFSPNGRSVVGIAHDNTVSVVDISSRYLTAAARHEETVDRAFARDGILYTTSWDNFVRAWFINPDRHPGDPMFNHTETLYNIGYAFVQVSPSGNTVLAPLLGKGFRVWRMNQKQEPRAVVHRGDFFDPWNCAFSPDGRWMAAAGTEALQSVGSPETTRPLAGLDEARQLRFGPDGSSLVGILEGRQSVRYWQLDHPDAFDDIPVDGGAESAFVDPVSRQIVIITSRGILLSPATTSSGTRPIMLPEDLRWAASSMDRSQSRLKLLFGSELAPVWCLWDPSAPEVFSRRKHPADIMRGVVSDDGTQVAILDTNYQITLYEAGSGRTLATFACEKNVLSSTMWFSEGGNFLQVNGRLHSTKDVTKSYRVGTDSIVSPDDKWVASFSGGIILLKLDGSNCTLSLSKLLETGCLRFTPSGDRLLWYRKDEATLFRYRWEDLVALFKGREVAPGEATVAHAVDRKTP